MTALRFGSLFAGVGGFDLGFERAGWSCEWQVEWDKHCQSVLARHWPKVPRWSDVRDVNGAELPLVDCVTFGSPCQDMSKAGKRAGLNGERSILFYEAIRIIKEMRDASESQFPRWAVWENVAGSLSSSGGADFGAVLDTLADIGAVVIEWAVLDAIHWGVPQRRRRVFVVACFDPVVAAGCPDPLLPVGSCGGGGVAQSGSTGQAVADGVAGRSDVAGGVVAFSHTQGLDCQPSVDAWPTLRSNGSGHAVLAGDVLRRLSPLECERLQGWPDDHTRWRADGTEQPDGHRFFQCGNGVASPVAEWVARCIGSAEAAVLDSRDPADL